MLEIFTKYGKLPKNLIVITNGFQVITDAVRIFRVDNYKVHVDELWHINNVLRCKLTHKIIDRR